MNKEKLKIQPTKSQWPIRQVKFVYHILFAISCILGLLAIYLTHIAVKYNMGSPVVLAENPEPLDITQRNDGPAIDTPAGNMPTFAPSGDETASKTPPTPEIESPSAGDVTPVAPAEDGAYSENAQPIRLILDENNSKSIWSTSVFSYECDGCTERGGGGRADYRLRVGGWGDIYVTLIQINPPSSKMARKVELEFHVLGDEHPASTPTAMMLKIINEPWGWAEGDRVWWKDLPSATDVGMLIAPSGAGSVYSIDITKLYNQWVSGDIPNYGIMLWPLNNNNRFNNFASPRGESDLRPQLDVYY